MEAKEKKGKGECDFESTEGCLTQANRENNINYTVH